MYPRQLFNFNTTGHLHKKEKKQQKHSLSFIVKAMLKKKSCGQATIASLTHNTYATHNIETQLLHISAMSPKSLS